MEKKTNKDMQALGYCTSTLIASAALKDIIEDADKALKTMLNIVAFADGKNSDDIKKAFKIKSANDCVKDAKDKPVTLDDINKACVVKKAYAESSFASWHEGKKTQAAHSEGFDDGWQAALTVFSELCPEFGKWLNSIE